MTHLQDQNKQRDKQGDKQRVGIIGAGPAGLTAAHLLVEAGYDVVIFETDKRYVGGISRTVSYKGYHFDIGGHRFFSKSQWVEDFWTKILGDEMLERPRSSRIFYRGKFFEYPLKPFDALLKLGVWESFLCVCSYAKAQFFPKPELKNFEDWVSAYFGARLYRIFFKTYTEKVWGMSCRDISADWAAQRIKGLSLWTAIVNAFHPRASPQVFAQVSAQVSPEVHGITKNQISRGSIIKTLVQSFRYPKYGPGQFWTTLKDHVLENGGKLHMGAPVTHLEAKTKGWLIRSQSVSSENNIEEEVDHVISSTDMRHLTRMLPHLTSQHHGEALKYRDFITVVLMGKELNAFHDNWLYIHMPEVKVGRIQNFKSWSPYMVPDPTKNAYGLEYFCFEGDGLWSLSDEDLIQLAIDEMLIIGLIQSPEDIEDGVVVRQAKAYPVYDDEYAMHVKAVADELEERHPTLHLVGRNGLHKYNNQDHAIMTARLTVENIKAGERVYDVWKVNQDAAYHEEGTEEIELRDVPRRVSA